MTYDKEKIETRVDKGGSVELVYYSNLTLIYIGVIYIYIGIYIYTL